jgi:phage shock protein PspC (stress-responsive transcriptional regulator)
MRGAPLMQRGSARAEGVGAGQSVDGWVRDNAHMSYSNGSGKVLFRPRENRIIAGVCAGLAEYTGMDVNLIRVIAALVTLFTAGTGLLAYVVAWIVIPDEGQKTSIAEDLFNKARQG